MIYVHVPFCRSFCTYCDFFSELCPVAAKGVGTQQEAQLFEKYADEVCSELAVRSRELADSACVPSLYLGGGTPSVLPLSAVCKIANAAKTLSPISEFTIEVNPEDIVEKGIEYARGLKEIGVNRISMGVQSLDDATLRWMNRRHNSDGARKAFRMLRDAGFGNVSVDLIFGLSDIGSSSAESLRATLSELIGWRPEHISAYQLSIEEGSALAKLIADGRYKEAPGSECHSQYELICRELSAAGYEHYEISNWALPGCRSQHNSAYWKRIPYVGVGPGAHSLTMLPTQGEFKQLRSWNSEDLSGWTSESEELSAREILEEQIMLGLRTAEGIDPQLIYPLHEDSQCVRGRLVRTDTGRLRIPETEFFVSDDIISGIFAETFL